MMSIFLEIILAVLIVAAVGWIVFVCSFTRQVMATFFKGEAPFVPTKAEYLLQIAGALDLKEDSVLFDLGSGDARILTACFRKQPKARYVGFEKSIVPYLWSKLRLRKMGLSKKIKIHKKDFFEADLGEATHIFLYLMPRQIEKLVPKLEKETQSSQKMISLRFGLPGKTPQKTVLLGKEKLFIYI